MDIDAIIEASMPAQPTEVAQPQADAPTEAPKEEPIAETPEPEAAELEAREEAFPKKAVNAISRRDKQIGKLRAEREALQAEVERYRSQNQPQAATGEPTEKDFNNYADYLEAKNAYKIDQKFSEVQKNQQETQRSSQEQAWVTEREAFVTTKAQEFLKEVPDAQSVLQEHADLADELPPQIQRLFLECENAPLAFYNLAKEGKLESLNTMSLARAAMEIGRAETQAPPKPKTKAPTPMPAARGSVSGEKQLHEMTQDELLKWVKS